MPHAVSSSPSRRVLPGVTRDNVLREVMAGVTLLALSVPLNIGYAQIAGLPASAGLYALILPSLLFALMASTRQVVVAPDAAAAALVASSLAGIGAAGIAGPDAYAAMAAAQAVLGGVLFLICGKLKLGFLADFLSRPILVGFVGGLALEVGLSQVAKMLGVRLGEGEFFEKAWTLLEQLPEAHGWSVVVSAGCLSVLLLGRHLTSKVPWALIVMAGATLATLWFSLETRGVSVLGPMPSGPPKFAVPDLPLSVWLALVPSAVALTAVTVAEGLMIARTYSDKNAQPHDPDRDLTAFGLANIGAGLSSSFSVGSSTSRTAAMDSAGARTQVPSVVLALGSLLLLVFGADLLSDIPSPAIGATVAVAVSGLVGVGEMRQLWRLSRPEFAIAVVAYLGVLLIGPIGGILIAFVLALVNLTRRAATSHVLVLADPRRGPKEQDLGESPTQTVPGVLVLRLGGPIFFANATAFAADVRQRIDQAPDPVRLVVLDLASVTDLDVTAAEELARLAEALTAEGTEIALARVSSDILEHVERFGLFAQAHRYTTNRAALDAFAARPAESSLGASESDV